MESHGFQVDLALQSHEVFQINLLRIIEVLIDLLLACDIVQHERKGLVEGFLLPFGHQVVNVVEQFRALQLQLVRLVNKFLPNLEEGEDGLLFIVFAFGIVVYINLKPVSGEGSVNICHISNLPSSILREFNGGFQDVGFHLPMFDLIISFEPVALCDSGGTDRRDSILDLFSLLYAEGSSLLLHSYCL